ncbi:MAG: hypothetical protein AAF456_18510 [Planctomycetota bacterium]
MRILLLISLLAFAGCGDSGPETPPPAQTNTSRPEPPRLTDPGMLAELPEELSYLVEPALEYGRFQFEEQIFDFLDTATPQQMEELAAVARRVKSNDHYPEVNRFLDEYPITEHKQSACLYFLFGVLDFAELSFEPPAEQP